ncbi:hypothetical protein ALC53_09333 [Atta colombica]|uniref:Uncharacterized protein n=1 Tax=Atta colombica TaxID=520822 RepID=A0A195B7R6_9HYME|nr:hypothetical protein ALC53_09333 [Atta colombica]
MKVLALNVNNFLKGLTQIYRWWYSKSERFGDFCQIQEKDYNKYIAYLQLYIGNFIPREFIFVHGYTGYLKISKKTKFLWSQYQQSVTTAAFSTSRSSGGSNCTIQSTSGISRPLAATSVQKNSVEKDLITYMNTHYWQIDIIQQFMMIFNGHARTKENHYFLLFIYKLFIKQKIFHNAILMQIIAIEITYPGIKNAKVLPDPVLAAPTKSLPSKRGEIAFACISVIFVKPISFIAFNVFSHTFPFNTEKLVSFVTSKPTAVPEEYLLCDLGLFQLLSLIHLYLCKKQVLIK